MYGKAVKLEKPFAVLERAVDTTAGYNCDNAMDTDESNDTDYLVKAFVKQKLIFKVRPKPIIANVAKKI